MTKISDVYDAFDNIITTTLPSYTKLPDGYQVEENNVLYLKKAYGIGYGAGNNSQRALSCTLSVNQSWEIALVNQITTTDHNVTARVNQEKALMEDAYSLVKATENDQDLSNVVSRTAWLDWSGIEYLDVDRARFYVVFLTFEIEFFDNL